jgi:acetolactate synthase-1/2/3 large subunit
MKASDLFVKSLEHEGVDYIFGLPGEENLDLVESIRTSKIKLIVTRDEQTAGFMAATYGRLTGKVGVCLSTLGPGATNFVTPAAYAQLGAMPILMVTGQKPIKQSKQGHFQIVNVVEMFRPITKMTKQIVSATSIPALVHEVCRTAVEERPGAVHLEFPEDIAREEVASPVFLTNYKYRRSAAEEKAVLEAVKMIESAKSPLILIGAGANRKLVSKSLLAFIEKTGIPFFSTQMGKGVIDERHPLYLGTTALSAGDYVHCAIDRADIIINVGHDVVEKPPFFMKPHQQVIHINFSRPRVDEVYYPQWEVVGDIGNSIWQMTEKISPQKDWDFSYDKKVKAHADKQIMERHDSANFPLLPQRIVADVRSIMPEDGIIALDNGMYKLWFARNYKAFERNTILLDNALATMGAGLPSAMAAKLVNPDKKVLAICGDGGFMMNVADLETAVRLKLDLVVLILNDSGYGMIQWKQKAGGFADFGLKFGNPDFVMLAKSFGATGHLVKKADDLVKMITEAFSLGGVHLIEVPIDYSENQKVFDIELKEKTCEL